MSRARNIAILLDGNGDVNTSALDNATTSLSDLGVTATATEINYVDGVTSNVQTQIDGKQNPLTAGTDYQTPLTAGTDYLTPTGDASQLTNLPAGYTDSDTAAYLSNNGYDTATNIVASITDSAPATLDTLNELAAALGDDPNFATTVTNNIATKAPLASPTFTGIAQIQQNVATNNPTLVVEQIGEGGNSNDTQGVWIKVDGTNNGSGKALRVTGTNSNLNGGTDIEAFTVYNNGKFEVNQLGTSTITSKTDPAIAPTLEIISDYDGGSIHNLRIKSNYDRDAGLQIANSVSKWSIWIDGAAGDELFFTDQNDNPQLHLQQGGGARFYGYLRVGDTTLSASTAGAGSLRYDNTNTTLLLSNGSAWAPVYRERDGSSTKPIYYLSDAIGLATSDTTLYVNPHNLGDTVQYTVDFSNAASPKYQTSRTSSSNSGSSGVGGECVNTSGTIGGCSQGTSSSYDVYSHASYCMKAGMRLCTRAEIKAGAAGGSGCSHDSRAIWTSDNDGNGNFWRVQGNTPYNEQQVSGTNTTPSGFDINEHGIRCCNPTSGVNLWEI